MSVCLSVNQIDLVFGSKPKIAFQALDQGKKRDQIQKETGQIVGVHRASLSVQSGEILVIMGLSGSGKSSLLRCLNGMNGRGVGVVRGDVFFYDSKNKNKINITQCPLKTLREVRRHFISMVFQQFGLMPWRTVYRNVAYPLELQKISQDEVQRRVNEKLELVGLTNWKARYPFELSGGMQQRVGLARAFVTDAPILLMDEPFSALDPLHRKYLQDEVLDLQKKLKKTIVFVTHDFNEAVRIADRIAIMDAGQILQLSTPEEVIASPACEKVREFVNVTA